MRPSDSQTPPPATPLRVLSGLLALMVFVLACAAQSPTAHAWLHGAEAPHEACVSHTSDAGDDTATPATGDANSCPVTLIAQGLTLPLAAPDVAAPISDNAIPLRPTRDATALAAPDRLHPPAHAPPVAA